MPENTDGTASAGEPNDQANEFEPITSQEEFDKRLSARLARERAKFADYDDLKAKAEQVEEFQSTIAQLETTNGELTAKVQDFEAKEQRAALLADVAKESGVPANLLRGSTREELEAHAEELKPLLKPSGPYVPGQEKTPDKVPESEDRTAVKKLFGAE